MKDKEIKNTETTLDTEEVNQEQQQEIVQEKEVSQENQELINLQSEVKALKEENQSLKDSLELEHTKSEELSSSVSGLKDDLKKLKEAYAEQFETKTVNKETVKIESSNKRYDSLSSEIFDLISK